MYQVLARKYRPRNFAELVGQTHVSRALGSALERGRLHHAYLFTGTRGVGKTTIARILSKCLNCETGITATPCGVCGTCRAIDEGRFIDLIEIDAASRTKVEDTRELLDNVPYAPTQGRYKVYLIDEVHMLSTHSFNALLKTLEEPPEHVKFLLATTDPQKLPVTVLSRCLQFTLRPLPRQEIHDHLAQVLGKEQIAFDDAALWLLAESAQGSLRDAMSLTDQAIAYGQGSVQGADVQAMLGLLDRSQVAHLLQAIHQGQGDRVAKILFDLTQQAVDVSAVLDQLITLLHQVALAQLLPKQADIGTPLEAEILHQLASSLDRQDVQLYYQIALQGRADLKLAVTAQQGFEMCVLRLLAFRPLAVTETVVLKQNHESGLGIDHIHAHQTSQPERLELNDDVELKKNSEVIPPSVIHHPIAESSPVIVQPAEETSLQVHVLPALVGSEGIDQEEQVELSAERIDAHDAESTDQSFLASPHDYVEDMVGDEQILNFEAEEPQAVDTLVVDPLEFVENGNVSAVEEPFHVPFGESTASVQTTTTVYQSGDLNPFEILAHPVAELSGEWTAEKWEYWLRERALVGKLFGGVLSLGQHGLMRGAIGGAIEFVIAAEHRVLTAEMRHGLLEALKEDWPQTQLEITNVTPDEITPVQRKELRIKQAQIKARELLVIDPVVAPLLTEFEGEIIELVMKEGLAG